MRVFKDSGGQLCCVELCLCIFLVLYRRRVRVVMRVCTSARQRSLSTVWSCAREVWLGWPGRWPLGQPANTLTLAVEGPRAYPYN